MSPWIQKRGRPASVHLEPKQNFHHRDLADKQTDPQTQQRIMRALQWHCLWIGLEFAQLAIICVKISRLNSCYVKKIFCTDGSVLQPGHVASYWFP